MLTESGGKRTSNYVNYVRLHMAKTVDLINKYTETGAGNCGPGDAPSATRILVSAVYTAAITHRGCKA